MTLLDLSLRKLERFAELTDEDRDVFLRYATRLHRLGAREDIIKQGQEAAYTNVVLKGWACRYKQIEDGRRQITAFLLPGDMCDPMVFLIDQMSHSLSSLTPVVLARFTRDEMEAMATERPNLAKAFLFETLVAAEIQREWTVNLGCRSAMQRMAHLFCELHLRLRSAGVSNGAVFDLPMTQVDLADALGLSIVHVNRMLQELRGTGLVELKGRKLTIHNEQQLRGLALFDPNYLHLQASRPPGG